MATVKLRKPNAVRDVAILYCDNDILVMIIMMNTCLLIQSNNPNQSCMTLQQLDIILIQLRMYLFVRARYVTAWVLRNDMVNAEAFVSPQQYTCTRRLAIQQHKMKRIVSKGNVFTNQWTLVKVSSSKCLVRT